MKNFKKQNIIIGLIAIVMVMSVGFVVNSYYVDKGTNDDYYSEALDYLFKTDGSDFDGIATTKTINFIAPGKQFWDGLNSVEKQNKILVATDLEIYKKYNISSKEKLDGNAVQGITFYQQHQDDPERVKTALTTTDNNGKATIKLEHLKTGNSNLVEGDKPKGKVNNNIKEFKSKETPIYVEPQIRFLGEVKGDKLIKGQLRKDIQKEYANNNLVTQIIDENNTWLKIYDKKEGKILYISKKPIGDKISWEELYKAKVVYGIGKDSKLKYDNGVIFKTKKTVGDGEWIKPLRVRLLRGYNNYGVDNPDFGEITKKSGIQDELKITQDSEWNKYILPLIGKGRYSNDSNNLVEKDLTIDENLNYKYRMANYTWKELMNNGSEGNLLQEKNIKRGNNFDASQIIYNTEKGVFRPVLEYLGCYDAACFEGEVAGTDFITYKELIHEITGKPIDKIKDKESTSNTIKIINGYHVNIDLGYKLPEGTEELKGTPADDRPTGGNWLKIYDAKEGKTLYIAKKPLTKMVSWRDLFDAGVVYGLDQIDITKIQQDGTIKKEAPYTGEKGYKPKIIKIKDSSGTEKKFIVRLLKGHNTNIHKGDPNTLIGTNKGPDVTQGSEWNRYILPLVKDYRTGINTYTTNYIEKVLEETKYKGHNIPSYAYLGDKNDYTIQLAQYNWFGDLTLGASMGYKYGGNTYNNGAGLGQSSWTQEYADIGIYETKRRSYRGGQYGYECAANSDSYSGSVASYDSGFRPVLEEIH